MNKVFAFLLIVVLAIGCVTTQPQTPAGCENAWVYKVPNFLPAGPAAIRMVVATVGAVKPEIRPAVASACVVAYKTLAVGSLANAIQALASVLKKPEIASYTTPAIVMLEELAAAGVINGQPVQLNDCDKAVLMSLMKNIGLDAGALPTDF